MTSDSDFDARLRDRLARLEAAAPAGPARGSGIAATALHGRRRIRRRTVAALAVAAVLTVAGAAAGQRMLVSEWQPASNAAPRALSGHLDPLAAALASEFDGAECMSPEDGWAATRRALDATGHSDWSIEERSNASQARCVGGLAITSEARSVILFPVPGAAVNDALAWAREELLDRCLGRSEATELMRAALLKAGATNFEIRADPWGPKGGPSNRIGRYHAHVNAGCTVLVGGFGLDETGKFTYYLWRNWP